MFTGIITHLGTVTEIADTRLIVAPEKGFLDRFSKGLSVSVNGICLTVVSFYKKDFTIDFMPETAQKTNISSLEVGSLVNLELPATGDTFLSGHIVQGHVDDIGTIKSIIEEGNSYLFTFGVSKDLTKYIVPKGSITVNGISLTVIDVAKDMFSVGIIPHTWERTMLHKAKVGDKVNIEVDVLAKYIEKLGKK